ncbi:MAG: hypothetical protein R3D29_12400 [Nitratireductor sp.]
MGVATAYVMLAGAFHSPRACHTFTKGYWGMGIFPFTLSLVNFVKYRMDDRIQSDRLRSLKRPRTKTD